MQSLVDTWLNTLGRVEEEGLRGAVIHLWAFLTTLPVLPSATQAAILRGELQGSLKLWQSLVGTHG